MGHLNIVNDETFKEILKTGFVSTRGNLGKQWYKTIADLFSDALATRPGHLFFPWFTDKNKSKCIGFKGFLRISGYPIFVQGDKYPIKIPVDFYNGFDWNDNKCLEEHEALDLWRRKLLWNAIGKKSLGRGRSIVHQTSWEDEELLNLIFQKTKNQKYYKINSSSQLISNNLQISIHNNLCKCMKILDSKYENETLEIIWELNGYDFKCKYKDISEIPALDIRWDDGKGFFIVEKALEAWIMENIDKHPGKSFREIVLNEVEVENIKEFYNYLPFGVAGQNMDVLVITKSNDLIHFHVIELKESSFSYKNYQEEVEKILSYKRFIEEFIQAYEIPNARVTAKIITGKPSKRTISEYMAKGPINQVEWFYYQIKCNGKDANVIFHKLNTYKNQLF